MRNRPTLRYPGGKYLLAPWIIAHLPPHRTYVEPYMGAASVLLTKPRAHAEILSDLDSDVVNFFEVLRDPCAAKDLRNVCGLTPFAEDEFRKAFDPAYEPVERARRLLVRSFMGHGPSGATGTSPTCTGFRRFAWRSGTTPAHDWKHWPQHIARFTERLRGVTIIARPALDALQIYDRADTCFYVDPPYVRSTRNSNQNLYRHEMSDDDHRELAAVLRSLAGAVVLSGYPCALYDKELFADWQRVVRSAHGDGAAKRTEVLWLSPSASAALPRLDLFKEAQYA